MNDTIFLVEGDADILQIKKDLTKYAKSKIFVLDYKADKLLTVNKISHEIAENYITLEDRRKVDQHSIHATTMWYENSAIKELLTFEGIRLGFLIQMELLQYFVTVYANAAMIDKIIEQESPTNVISHTSLNDYVRRICKKKSIHLTTHDLPQLSSIQSDVVNIKYNLGSYPMSINISRKTFMRIKKVFDKTINLIFKFKADLRTIKNNKSILLLDFNVVTYDLLIHELSSLNKNIILLNQRRPAIWNLQSFKIIKNSNCKILHLSDFEEDIGKKIDFEIKTLESNLSKIWNMDVVFEEMFSFNSITLWYAIKESFMNMCTSRFCESVRRILLLNKLFDSLDVSVILEWAETAQEEKEIITLAKKRGIQSILLQHAMDLDSPIWDKYNQIVLNGYTNFISNKQALWNEQVKKRAVTFGNKEEDLVVTGSPRHDNFFNSAGKGSSKGIILFATTAVTGRISFEQTYHEAYIKFESFVKEVCRVAKQFHDKQLIVKPHPQSDLLSNITKIIKEIDPTIPILYNANLIELINSCDMLISFNNSTVVMESMILGKPTISLQIEKWAEEDQIVKSGALLSISKIEEIETGMKKILSDKKYCDNLIENSKIFLNKSLANQGTASPELTKLLDSF
ncbi:MAG: UDP-N-acetylglucosamine 2-epimerase [Nitrosotalea sp.]